MQGLIVRLGQIVIVVYSGNKVFICHGIGSTQLAYYLGDISYFMPSPSFRGKMINSHEMSKSGFYKKQESKQNVVC